MPNIKTQSIVDYFLGMGKHVFTVHDVAKLTRKKESYLSRLLPTNPKIRRIERGKYYIDGADIYEVASNIVEPSYVSFMGAFRYYGLTTQEPVFIGVVTALRHKRIEFNGITIGFVTFKRERIFGYRKAGNVRIATVEKALIDSMCIGNPPYADVEEALERALSKKLVDAAKLKEYALVMGSGRVASRLGFLLESLGIGADALLPHRAKRSVLLFGKGSKKDKRWGVLFD